MLLISASPGGSVTSSSVLTVCSPCYLSSGERPCLVDLVLTCGPLGFWKRSLEDVNELPRSASAHSALHPLCFVQEIRLNISGNILTIRFPRYPVFCILTCVVMFLLPSLEIISYSNRPNPIAHGFSALNARFNRRLDLSLVQPFVVTNLSI